MGEKIIFSVSCAGSIAWLYTKKKGKNSDLHLTTYKNNSKCIINLYIRPKIIKLLKENIEKIFVAWG